VSDRILLIIEAAAERLRVARVARVFAGSGRADLQRFGQAARRKTAVQP